MVKFDDVRKKIHRPHLRRPAQDSLDVILIEAGQAAEGEHLVEARPAPAHASLVSDCMQHQQLAACHAQGLSGRQAQKLMMHVRQLACMLAVMLRVGCTHPTGCIRKQPWLRLQEYVSGR